MSTPPVEVRQCPKCQAPAVVNVFEWQHSIGSTATGDVTREFRCQQCGAWQVRKPKTSTIAMWIVGGIFTVTTCVFGLPFLFIAWRQQTFDKRVPVVPGVHPPLIRFPGGPPKRTCGKCGGTCVAVAITRHTHRGVPTGTDYKYECAGCRLTFETENVLGHITSGLGVLALLGAAAGFYFTAKSAGWKWGGSLVALAFVGLLVWQGVDRIANRFKHPPQVSALSP